MATVTTPAGEVLEGVTGPLLDYYRGEGYEITDDEPVEDAPVVEAVEPEQGEQVESPDDEDDDVPPGPLGLH